MNKGKPVELDGSISMAKVSIAYASLLEDTHSSHPKKDQLPAERFKSEQGVITDGTDGADS